MNIIKTKLNLRELKESINKLDHIHTHERKIKFLLDIRGYLKINKLAGEYVEFGSFLSEMQTAAFLIFKKKCKINSFIGIR